MSNIWVSYSFYLNFCQIVIALLGITWPRCIFISTLYQQTNMVLEAECSICTIKDQLCCVYTIVLFHCIPNRMIINIYGEMFWFNIFPNTNGLTKMLSPMMIIMGRSIIFNIYYNIECDQYIQTHNQHANLLQGGLLQ